MGRSPKQYKTLPRMERESITNVTERIEKLYGKELKNYQSPMESTYRLELDATKLLTENERAQYQILVGCGNWVITLGRYDVQAHYAVSTMARYSAAPRQGHVAAMMRLFGYLAAMMRLFGYLKYYHELVEV
jgi:hypothetical protein